MSGKGNQTHSNAQHIVFLLEKGDWIHFRSMISYLIDLMFMAG